MTGPELFILGIVGVFAIAAAVALIRHRKATFARVRAAYLRSRVTTGGPGLFLEREPVDDAFVDVLLQARAARAAHSCSFGPDCPHLEREAQRRATAIRLNGGPAA